MRKPSVREQPKKYVFGKSGLGGYPLIRVKHNPERKLGEGKGVKCAHYVLRCGDCDEKLEIYYGQNFLEINGVEGSLENWCVILLPLLGINPKAVSVEQQARQGKSLLAKLRKKYAHP